MNANKIAGILFIVAGVIDEVNAIISGGRLLYVSLGIAFIVLGIVFLMKKPPEDNHREG